jgi:hypothetical protein
MTLHLTHVIHCKFSILQVHLSILAEENKGDSADHALIKDVLVLLLESQRVIVIMHSGPLSIDTSFLHFKYRSYETTLLSAIWIR